MRLVFGMATVVALPTLASAQMPPQAGTMTPEVVVTATRVPTEIENIPAGVTVITRQEIEERGYNTLAEALSAVPGVRVAQSGGPGGEGSVFIRGTNSNQVLVLRDGMPINDPSDPGAAFNFGIDTLADVERIEIIRGPMAALYGSGAIGGVINLITVQGHQPGVHLYGDLAGGYPQQIQNSEVLSGVKGPLDYAAVVQTESLQGFDYTPQRESIYTGAPQGYRDQIGTVNLGYTPVPGTRFSLLFRGRRAVFGFNELGSPTFDDANSTGHDTSLLGRIGVHSLLAGGLLETGLSLGHLQDDRKYYEPFNPDDPNLATNDSRYHSYETDLQWNNVLHLGEAIRSPMVSMADVTFGFEQTSETAKTRINSMTAGFPYQQSFNASMTDNAVYAGFQTTLAQRLTVTGQIRQDWVLNDQPFTWRLGVVFDAREIRTHFHAAYGTAFLAPSLFDRFGVDSTGYIGNPNLLAETAQGWEVGFTTDVPALGRLDAVSFDATYFNEQITNLIETVFPTPTTSTSENVGSAHIEGVETELTLRPTVWFLLDATYTWTQPQNADTGMLLLRRPQNTASVDAVISPVPKLRIVPEVLFTGAFQDFLINDQGFSTGVVGTSRQGTIVNMTITYEITPRISAYANGRNIFNSRFEPVNGFQTPGGSFIAGVRFRL
jgi:vitamin B12 transporter